MKLYKSTINGRLVTATAPVIDILLRANKEEVITIGAVVDSSWRTYEQQLALVQAGKSQTVESNHRRGMAIDMYPDHSYLDKIEVLLRRMGMNNPISWDRVHFIYGQTESEVASKYEIINDSTADEYNPIKIKICFILTQGIEERGLLAVHQICNKFSEYSDGKISIEPKIVTEVKLRDKSIGIINGKNTYYPDTTHLKELYDKYKSGFDIVQVISNYWDGFNCPLMGNHYTSDEIPGLDLNTKLTWLGLLYWTNQFDESAGCHEILHTIDDFYREKFGDYSIIDKTHDFDNQGKIYEYITQLTPLIIKIFDKHMILKKEKGKPNIYAITEDNKKIMIVDMPALDRVKRIIRQTSFEEVDSLSQYQDDGTIVWTSHIIN